MTHPTAPHFILSFHTTRGRDGCPRRTEAFATFGYDGFDHPQSLDTAEPKSLGQFSRPEYARIFGWQRLYEAMQSAGLDPAEARFTEVPSRYESSRTVPLKEVLYCAKVAPTIAVRVKTAPEPAFA